MSYIKPLFGTVIVGLVFKFVGSIMELFLPMLLSYIVDDIVPSGSIKMIYICGALMLICSIIAFLGNVAANRIAAKVSRDAAEKIRNDLFERISYLSARQIDEFTIPSLESRLTSDTYNIHQMIGMIQRMGVRGPCLLIGGVIIAFSLEPILTLVMIAVMPLITFTVYFITKRGVPLFRIRQEKTDQMTRIVRENAQGIRIIKALGREDSEKMRFEESNLDLNHAEKKASLNTALTSPLMNLFLNFALIAVIIVGAIRVNSGATETGKIIAFTSYFTIILNALRGITRVFIRSANGIASANRIGEVLEAPYDMGADPAYDSPVQNICPKIEFSHVSFSYNGIKNDVDDISFTLDAGETLGIIGPTGSGKTTIIALLMRQYDVTSGSIKIDGRDIRSMTHEEITKKFGAAFQNDFLFADTIRSNITFGRNISDSEIEFATKNAQAESFISEKSGGLDFQLSIKGANLSGGQKQRLILSRALAGIPEILVLDDSSSALDYATDARLRTAIRENYSGKTTSVIVAQRISSIMHADKILVIEDGKITGYGTHDELVQKCPLYCEINASQIGGAMLE